MFLKLATLEYNFLDLASFKREGYEWVQFLLQGLMERCLSFFSSSVMKPNKKGIMVEKFFFNKSKFDYLAIGKEFGIVLCIIGILRVLAEIEFKFSNIQYCDTVNEQFEYSAGPLIRPLGAAVV